MQDAPRAAPVDARPGYGTRFLVVCYTGVGAVGCAFMFYVSTLPVTIPDDWGAQVPGVLGAITTLAYMLAALPWAVLPIPLLIRRRRRPAGRCRVPSRGLIFGPDRLNHG
jgi:hypothetical protein